MTNYIKFQDKVEFKKCQDQSKQICKISQNCPQQQFQEKGEFSMEIGKSQENKTNKQFKLPASLIFEQNMPEEFKAKNRDDKFDTIEKSEYLILVNFMLIFLSLIICFKHQEDLNLITLMILFLLYAVYIYLAFKNEFYKTIRKIKQKSEFANLLQSISRNDPYIKWIIDIYDTKGQIITKKKFIDISSWKNRTLSVSFQKLTNKRLIDFQVKQQICFKDAQVQQIYDEQKNKYFQENATNINEDKFREILQINGIEERVLTYCKESSQ